MKRGRPTMHTKARWVTFIENDTELFFKLDDKGNLIKDGKEFTPDHTNPYIPKAEIIKEDKLSLENTSPDFVLQEEIPFNYNFDSEFVNRDFDFLTPDLLMPAVDDFQYDLD